MSETRTDVVTDVCRAHGHERTRLLDIAREIQRRCGAVSPENVTRLAAELSIPRVEIEALVSFYAFLSFEKKGAIVIRVCDGVVERMSGYDAVVAAFSAELGIDLGETTEDGAITLERTPCIGQSDQAPAALVNEVVVTALTPERAREIVRALRDHGDPARLVEKTGDGRNSHALIRAMVRNNLREPGEVIFSPIRRGEAIRKAITISPMEVIRAVKTARLRGRGGAGFPTGMKWEFARAAPGERKYVICNADEGEPGTFKDRVLLTERANRVIAGMTIAGYAVGADSGIIYLRAEYAYLRGWLDGVLEARRRDGLLGRNILGQSGFNFRVRIQMGAGAYVCGEETSLISSCEGHRGDPKNRPPFPAQKGYRGFPTVVNNVETLCCVAKILHEGPATFCQYGTKQSSGTKVLSVSGDCRRPGVYELPFGVTLREILARVGGDDAIAVQMGGPSGSMVGPDGFDRALCFDDLATGGSVVVFGPGRDLLEVVHANLEFFEEESCGYCTPCRVGTVLLRRGIERILANRGEEADLEHFATIAKSMKTMSRCGLGQTASNPVLSTLANFREIYESRLAEDVKGRRRSFDLEAELSQARELRAGKGAGR